MELTQEHIEFLDLLRLSGQTNMFGAGPYLQEEFGLSRADARNVLVQWIAQFKED